MTIIYHTLVNLLLLKSAESKNGRINSEISVALQEFEEKQFCSLHSYTGPQFHQRWLANFTSADKI